MSLHRRATRAITVLAIVAAGLSPVGGGTTADAVTVPSGFREQIIFSGLQDPVNIEFARDGRVFVAEKAGRIKVFDSLDDPTPTVFADLSTEVFGELDRGLLGMALDPDFPAQPYIYVLYTRDAAIGEQAPKWHDYCPDHTKGRCVVSGRLSRLTASGNQMTGKEQPLIQAAWCQQFGSHSIGDVQFGPDGALYATGGDGAMWTVDYGQLDSAANPCKDPPGGAMTPPSAEGGALRAQDIRTTADPFGVNGALLRLDKATRDAMIANPTAAPKSTWIAAYGLRNPMRLTFRPGASPLEAWIGDVGWGAWEEIDRVVAPSATAQKNFGWPCYEGAGRQSGYDSANLSLCETLYAQGTGAVSAPYYAYAHANTVVANEACPKGGSAITGLAFYPTGSAPYPSAYRGALFFADYARQCIWAMQTGTNGLPSASKIVTFAVGAARPVDLTIGPDGMLYYVDLGGTVRRFRYFSGNQPPVAAMSATPVSGPPPLAVKFDATATMDPDAGDTELLTYEWDFNYQPVNGFHVDATGTRTPTYTYANAGTFTAALRVRDRGDLTDLKTQTIEVGADKPLVTIDTPGSSLRWSTDQVIPFSGHAVDAGGNTLPASQLTWELILFHCYPGGGCHEHHEQTMAGVASGSFPGPDHEYPSYLELRLTATDSLGRTSTAGAQLTPQTVNLTFDTSPARWDLTVGADTRTAPFTVTVIAGSTVTVSAPSTVNASALQTCTLRGWSDGGAATHVIVAPAAGTRFTAVYARNLGSPPQRCGGSPQPGTAPRRSLLPG